MPSDIDDSEPTPQDLREFLSVRYYCSSIAFRHYDEVFPGIYLGDMKSAKNIFNLERLQITHVLNVAYSPSPYTDKETSEAYYRERNFPCDFLGIPAQDFPSYKIGVYFEEAANFIHEALKSKGKILVHCQVGISRSATIVIAYLMMKQKMSALQAVTLIGCKRPIFPNEGFLKQICDLEYKLKHPRRACQTCRDELSPKYSTRISYLKSISSGPGQRTTNCNNGQIGAYHSSRKPNTTSRSQYI